MSDSEDSGVDIQEIKREILDLYKKVSQKRFKALPNGYTLDRWLTISAMLLTFCWLFFVAYSYNYDLDYYECVHGPGMAEFYPDGSQRDVWSQDYCRNPFYKPSNWKNEEFLPPGEYGTKLGPLFHSVYYSPILIFGLAFGLNHLIHNRRKTP